MKIMKFEMADLACGLVVGLAAYVVSGLLKFSIGAGVVSAATSWISGWDWSKKHFKVVAASMVALVILTISINGVNWVKNIKITHSYKVVSCNYVDVITSKNIKVEDKFLNEFTKILGNHNVGKVVLYPQRRSGKIMIHGEILNDSLIHGAVMVNSITTSKIGGFFGYGAKPAWLVEGAGIKFKWEKKNTKNNQFFVYNPKVGLEILKSYL